MRRYFCDLCKNEMMPYDRSPLTFMHKAEGPLSDKLYRVTLTQEPTDHADLCHSCLTRIVTDGKRAP